MSRLLELEDAIWSLEQERDALATLAQSLPHISRSGKTISVRNADGEDSEDAARTAIRDAQQLKAALHDIRRRLGRLRTERARLGQRWPIGMADIGAELGYPDATVRQWKLRGLLPEPAGAVGGSPFWWRSDIITWSAQRRRDRRSLSLPATTQRRSVSNADAYGAYVA